MGKAKKESVGVEVAFAFNYFSSKRVGPRYRSNKTLTFLYSLHEISCHENICRNDRGKPHQVTEKMPCQDGLLYRSFLGFCQESLNVQQKQLTRYVNSIQYTDEWFFFWLPRSALHDVTCEILYILILEKKNIYTYEEIFRIVSVLLGFLNNCSIVIGSCGDSENF